MLFFQFILSLDVLAILPPSLWSALLRRSRELGCPNACPWMSRLKPWDSARELSRSQSSLHPHPDPDGMVAGPGARGWIVR